MAAVHESMRPPLEEGNAEKNERVVLGTLPPADKREAKPGRVGVALAVIFMVATAVILFILVPMFWDVLGR
jgi:hypothetical protein